MSTQAGVLSERKVATWADGFGNWHARIAESHDQAEDARLARRAILRELYERGQVLIHPDQWGVYPDSYRMDVGLVKHGTRTIPGDPTRYVEYVEVWHD